MVIFAAPSRPNRTEKSFSFASRCASYPNIWSTTRMSMTTMPTVTAMSTICRLKSCTITR